MMTLGLDNRRAAVMRASVTISATALITEIRGSLIQYVNRVAVQAGGGPDRIRAHPNGGMAESVAAAIFSTLTRFRLVEDERLGIVLRDQDEAGG